jgi:hypothetical protein
MNKSRIEKCIATLCVLVMALGCAKMGDFLGGLLDNPVVVAVLNECGELPAAEFDECALGVLTGLVDPDEASVADYLRLAQELRDQLDEEVEE